MVQSSAPTVDAYLADVEPARADALHRLRDACRARFTGWEERMQWGMPGYGPPGEDARISFNGQKNYIAVYVGQTVVDRYKPRLKGATFGKGCVRFARVEAIDFDLLGAMLSEAFAARGGSS